MNHIFKTVWNALRRCLVVVNEVTKSTAQATKVGTLVVASSLLGTTANALPTFELGQDYKLGVLNNFSSLKIVGVNRLEIDRIDATNGCFVLQETFKQEWLDTLEDSTNAWDEAYNYDIDTTTWLPKFQINNGINVALFTADSVGVINGDVKINGTVSREMLDTYTKYKTPGVFFAGGSYDLGGITVNGNLTASLLQVGDHQHHSISQENFDNGKSVGGLIINGDATVDWVLVDTAKPSNSFYDNFTDYLEVNGTLHVKQDVFMGGQAKINKLIVDGVLYNAFGQYTYYPSLPEALAQVGGIFGQQPPDYVSMTIDELDAKTIVNASNLFVGTLTNDRNQVYTQTYGTIRVTNNWFKDSVINLSGGVIDEASLGPDKNLGVNNVFNVSGGTLKVGDLRGDSTIHLSDKGKLETKLDSVFEKYDGVANADGLNTIGLTAAVPEDVLNTITDLFRVYVPGEVIDNVMDRVTLSGGQIVISGVDLTTTQRDDLMAAFKETFC